jgi:hypothetical protein
VTRILLNAGWKGPVILGKEASEVDGCGDLLMDLLEYPKAKFLVLVDENLDFFEADSEQVVLSGSVVLKEILHNASRR